MKLKLALSIFTIAALAGACSGDDGATGPAGSEGPAGPTGPTGADGTDGTDGVDGQMGLPGQNLTGFVFRTDAPSAYTRVDRMGMPAVSTALIVDKNTYNDADPNDDVVMTSSVSLPQFVESDMAGQLASLHEALRDDLANASLTRCSTSTGAAINVLPCITQEVAAGVPVADLIVPDTLTVDPLAPAGFPNGRMLPDPVMNVTLSIILLDLEVHGPGTLVELLNPPENDVPFLDAFPYLGFPHAN